PYYIRSTMAATACFVIFVLLALRSLRLSLTHRAKPGFLRLVDLLYAAGFIGIALPLALFVPSIPGNIPLIVILLIVIAIPMHMLTTRRIRQPYSPRAGLFAMKIMVVLLLVIVSLVAVMMIGYRYLTEDEPVLKVIVTGNSVSEPVEWKSPEGTLQKQ